MIGRPQPSCSPISVPHSPQRGGVENSYSRALGAVLVAAGLAFSASLYPLPKGLIVSEQIVPGRGSNPGVPELIESVVANHKIDITGAALSQLARLAEILDTRFRAAPADAVLGLVERFGLATATTSLQTIASSAPAGSGQPYAFGGGGGGAVPSPTLPPISLPQLALFLEYLMQRFQGDLGQALTYVVGYLIPAQQPAPLDPHTVAIPLTVTVVPPLVPQTAIPAPAAPVSVAAPPSATPAPAPSAAPVPTGVPVETAAAPTPEPSPVAPPATEVSSPPEPPVSVTGVPDDPTPTVPDSQPDTAEDSGHDADPPGGTTDSAGDSTDSGRHEGQGSSSAPGDDGSSQGGDRGSTDSHDSGGDSGASSSGGG